jgi:hypothetical protein
MREAAAIVTFLSPGLRFFHQGQFEGRTKRISPHLVRAPMETVDAAIERFYGKLRTVLAQPVVRDGQWRLLECAAAWDGNGTWDDFIAWTWETPDGPRRLVVVNYAGHQGQCYVRLPFPDLEGRSVSLRDLMSPASYDRHGGELLARGLYLDLPSWGYHVFDVGRA